MRIELEVSEDCEGTSYPWWMIVKPEQNLQKNSEGACDIAMGMITGPYFSRESATLELESRRYHYGANAIVWCASGHRSPEYVKALYKSKGL